ncbi:siderophore-interacting protein [Qipengyuania qiaonensis]|uniref:Siderophore-interacting protein n=1 Tax=Qipengyuania qiaonensis TaxID=2867240 RepID=A0ABS7J5F0_9SPHN|nr:siderophore-interacting protein [Qipengyuania qiaonensis]MBX7482522.1 siderophore-interacting protein [Qipengyuania qiaonensis]
MSTRPAPRNLTVLSSRRLSPSMIRVSLGGDGIRDFPADFAGGYVKLMLEPPSATTKAVIRTYTIRHQRPGAIDVDFALHGGEAAGPATQWALSAQPGDTIAVGGPGLPKPLPPGRDFYLIAGDMTALPAISVNLAALPADARGCVAIEIQDEADRPDIVAPAGMQIEWLINPEPGRRPDLLADTLRSIGRPEGSVAGWAACEFSSMRKLRDYLRGELGLGGSDLYISSYWKHGLIEDEHKLVKRADAEAQPAG